MYECHVRQARIVPTILLHSRHPWRSDVGSGLFEPLDFLARLAALVPRLRSHLVRYHGASPRCALQGRTPTTAASSCRALSVIRMRRAGVIAFKMFSGVPAASS